MNGVESEEDSVGVKNEKRLDVLMSGYFPGVAAQRTPLTTPAVVRFQEGEVAGDSWKDVCAGGCGFGMAISGYSSFSLDIFRGDCVSLDLSLL